MIKVGDKIQFNKFNWSYWQDFFIKGASEDFKDIVWTVKSSIRQDTHFILEAPGYGLLSDYGSGCIFVTVDVVHNNAVGVLPNWQSELKDMF